MSGAARDPITRRDALRRAVAAAAGAGAGSGAIAGDAAAAQSADPMDRLSDGELLRRVLRSEQLVVWVYERVLSEGALRSGPRTTAQRLLGQEHTHIAVLERQLARMGGYLSTRWTLSSARAELARHQIAANLTELRTQHDCLRLLVDVESVAEGAWFAAISGLRSPALALLGARIMACEAQHWTILSGLSHAQDAVLTVPYPFVRGSSGY